MGRGTYYDSRINVTLKMISLFFVQKLEAGDVRFECYPVVRNGSQLLNPCGLYANTFFNGKDFDNPESTLFNLAFDS